VSTKKTIGILTSGGDCAGLNAAIRGVVHCAALKGWDVVGIQDGYMGLLDPAIGTRLLYPDQFDTNILRMGGTVLGTYRKNNPFNFPMPDGTRQDRSDEIIASIKKLGLDCLIGIGGDGSMELLSRLTEKGNIPFVGIPKTMDNDIGLTEKSIGYDTAVAIATEALDRLQPTAASHDRVMILEVMGRDAGHVALAAGISGGADIILIPEIPYSLDVICNKVRSVMQGRQKFCLMIVSEAVRTADGDKSVIHHPGGGVNYGGIGQYMGMKITDSTGAETRVTVLGHLVRGAPPTYADRLLASALAVHAVDLIEKGEFGHMVAWQNRQVVSVPIRAAFESFRSVDVEGTLVHTARQLGICLGDEVL
jgi:ATP-dependent phosphofructokinase / diphosphate-dependent phosphofructokinase